MCNVFAWVIMGDIAIYHTADVLTDNNIKVIQWCTMQYRISHVHGTQTAHLIRFETQAFAHMHKCVCVFHMSQTCARQGEGEVFLDCFV